MKESLILLPALAAGLIAYLLTPFVCALSTRVGAIDLPGPRKIHNRAVPRLGGVAIIAAVVLVVGSLYVLNFLGYGGLRPQAFRGIAFGLLPILAVALWDDIKPLSPWPKLIAQLAGAGIALHYGIRLNDAVHLFGRTISLGWVSIPLSLIWIIGVTNAFNIIDGLDGLSAGLALISAASLTAIALVQSNRDVGILSAVLVGSLIGFLPFNIFPAKVFLGDAGAESIGFYLACLALPSGSTLSSGVAVLVPLLAMGVPIADTLISMARRAIRQSSKASGLFQADAEHIHHRLIRLGVSHWHAVLLLYGVAVVLAGMGILSLSLTASNAALVLLTLMAAAFIGLGRLGYDEFAVLRRGLVLRFYDVPALQGGFFRVFVDMALVVGAFCGAVVLKFDDLTIFGHGVLVVNTLSILLPLTILVFWNGGLYQRSWRFASIGDVLGATLAVVASCGFGFVVVRLTVNGQASLSLFVIYSILLLVAVSAGRSSFRVLEYLRERHRPSGRRMAIYGAGTGGIMALREIHSNSSLALKVVGFIDDDPLKVGRRIAGYPILGNGIQLEDVIREHTLDGIILASTKISSARRVSVFTVCEAAQVSLLSFDLQIQPVSLGPQRPQGQLANIS